MLLFPSHTSQVSCLLLSLALPAFLSYTQAFQLLFPNPSSAWISCKDNALRWTFNETDPEIFSVALFNVNSTKVNGNYQIANSLPTRNGTAVVTPNCVEPGDGYFVAFVNASQYALGHPQIFFTSNTFSVKPRKEAVSTPSGTHFVNNGTALQTTDSGATIAQGTNETDKAPVNVGGPAVAGQVLPSSADGTTTGQATNKHDGAPSSRLDAVQALLLTVTGSTAAVLLLQFGKCD